MGLAALSVAHKELIDHLRDWRSLGLAVIYALMGPIIVGLLATSIPIGPRVGGVFASVFVLVAAFAGGLSMAADLIAGERERKSLLLLLLSCPSAVEVLVGKWLACWLFATAASLLTALGFAALSAVLPGGSSFNTGAFMQILAALAGLTALAVALEILFASMARSVKEAVTYGSILMFGSMGFSMWLAFRQTPGPGWMLSLPVVGHQQLFQRGFVGQVSPPGTTLGLVLLSGTFAFIVIRWAAGLFCRNEIDYAD